ncbi:MAG: hypothetical protein ABFC54_08350, partial [Thermoguttaceae bacterium]
ARLIVCCALGVFCCNSYVALADDGQGLFIPQADSSNSETAGNYWTGRQATTAGSAERSVARTYAVQRRPVAGHSLPRLFPEVKSTTIAKIVRTMLPWGVGLLATAGLIMALTGVVRQRRSKVGFLVRSTPNVRNAQVGWVDRDPARPVLALRLMQTDLPEPQHHFVDAQFGEEEEVRPLRRAA